MRRLHDDVKDEASDATQHPPDSVATAGWSYLATRASIAKSVSSIGRPSKSYKPRAKTQESKSKSEPAAGDPKAICKGSGSWADTKTANAPEALERELADPALE